MNSHLIERLATEEFTDIMRSVEFFILTVVALSVLGFVFLAVA